MLQNVPKGLVAGFIATLVLSALMVAKSMMGLMPELNVIEMLTQTMGASSQLAGWAVHFVIGSVVWGGLFALLAARIPGESFWLKGILFGVAAWLLMMILVMPMAGAGLFGLSLGIAAPIMTLMLHVVFGAVLGGVYAAQHPAPDSTAIGVRSL